MFSACEKKWLKGMGKQKRGCGDIILSMASVIARMMSYIYNTPAVDGLIKPPRTCRIPADFKFTAKESYILFFYISEDPFSAELDILFDESSASDLYWVSLTTWSKSFDRRLIGNGYDAF